MVTVNLQGKKNPGTDRQSVEFFLNQVKIAKEMKIDRYILLQALTLFDMHTNTQSQKSINVFSIIAWCTNDTPGFQAYLKLLCCANVADYCKT